MPAVPAWAAAKLGPLPVWGWGALALGGGVGFVVYKRRSSNSKSTAPTLSGARATPLNADSGNGGSFGGGSGSGQPGGSIGGLIPTPAPTPTPAKESPVSTQPVTGGISALAPPPYSGAPAVAISPSLLGGGWQLSQTQLSNPLGSADQIAANSGGYYRPSATDYATEQPGGLTQILAGLPGTEPGGGGVYTIYGTNTGTGPVIPAAQRLSGERYDALGRVIM